jgi:hypothetical protein
MLLILVLIFVMFSSFQKFGAGRCLPLPQLMEIE